MKLLRRVFGDRGKREMAALVDELVRFVSECDPQVVRQAGYPLLAAWLVQRQEREEAC